MGNNGAKEKNDNNSSSQNNKNDNKSNVNSSANNLPQPKNDNNNDNSNNDNIDINSLPEYTMDQVEKHDTKDKGVWIVLNNLVYNVTPFLSSHPGGAGFLLQVAGEDATGEFEASLHSQVARNKSKELIIGKLKKTKIKDNALSIKAALNPSNNIKKQKYPPSSNYNNLNNNNNSSSSKTKSKNIKFTNMKNDNKYKNDILILYGTQKGKSKEFAYLLYNKLINTNKNQNKIINICNMRYYDSEDLDSENIVIMITSTYENGTPPDNAKHFIKWINDAPSDCRISASFLQNTRFCVFGLGNSIYDDNYNKVSKLLYNNLLLLGGIPLIRLGLGDDDNDIQNDYQLWMNKLIPHINKALNDRKYPKNVVKKTKKVLNKNKNLNGINPNDNDHNLADMEDIGNLIKNGNIKNGKKIKNVSNDVNEQKLNDNDNSSSLDQPKPKPEMVTDRQRQSLTKQGYRVIGSHSGVKLCRWTKSMLRGRGGCYKNAFYGIKSYSCMEMTPSLACANKCVFCWRHHTNPVGKKWKWITDKPEFILNKAIENHKKMIKTMKGVPGVLPDRLKDAQNNIRHCALSLVGEPIMYPFINEYLCLLHSKRISSFLVTNAQFPDKIRNMSEPITQLYVSVDAATKDSLKAIDRPLFKDYWRRFLASLDALKSKKQRTVYRLTLVKSWNTSEIADYSRLIARGLPTFIEVKGVTFCGKSDGSSITMTNIPFHFEVIRFCEKLCEYLSSDYEIACEHQHSCCVLIAKKELKINNKWYTHIDYDKFFKLLESGNKDFGYKDYMAVTPDWAVIGSKEHGFNPNETKFIKKRHTTSNKKKQIQKKQILQQKIDAAKKEIENDKLNDKNNGKILPQNNPYLMNKNKNGNNCCNPDNDNCCNDNSNDQ